MGLWRPVHVPFQVIGMMRRRWVMFFWSWRNITTKSTLVRSQKANQMLGAIRHVANSCLIDTLTLTLTHVATSSRSRGPCGNRRSKSTASGAG